MLEVVSFEGPEAEIAIWNPDGSRAELSGNGTRIAARWLLDRSGAKEVRIRVGERVTRARTSGELVEQELGRVEVGPPEQLEGIEFVPVSVGNPHAVVEGDPSEIERIGPLLERHPHFPAGTNVQIARVEGPGGGILGEQDRAADRSGAELRHKYLHEMCGLRARRKQPQVSMRFRAQ